MMVKMVMDLVSVLLPGKASNVTNVLKDTVTSQAVTYVIRHITERIVNLNVLLRAPRMVNVAADSKEPETVLDVNLDSLALNVTNANPATTDLTAILHVTPIVY